MTTMSTGAGRPAGEHGFVGRADEWRALDRALDRGLDGKPSTVLVAGPAGIGKTRLVVEFAEVARERGVLVVDGACLELGVDALPYAPYVSIVEQLVRGHGVGTVLELAGPNGSALGRLVPALQVGDVDTGGVGRGQLANALASLFASFARRSPLLVVFDDVHWADESTRELLPVIVQALATVPATVLVTCREDELPDGDPLRRLLVELVRGPRGAWLPVSPLSRDEQAEQLAELLGAAPPDSLLDRVHDRAEGNPFFAEELVAAQTAAASPHRVTEADVPVTIRDLMLDRLLSLPDGTRDVLAAVAVAGQTVDTDLLAAVTGLTTSELEAALRPALTEHVCVQDAATGAVAFRHALLGEVAAGTVLVDEKVRLHGRLADALAAGRGRMGTVERVARIAHHRHAVGDPRAPTALLEAAWQLRDMYAHPEALAQYDRVLALVQDGGELPDGAPAWGEMLAEVASVANLAGEHHRAVELARGAIDEVDVDANPAEAGLLHSRLGLFCWLAGDDAGCVASFRKAERLVPASETSPARAQVLAMLAMFTKIVEGESEQARDLAGEALDLARTVGAAYAEGWALNALGVALVDLGQVEEGLARLHEARVLRASEAFEDADEAIRPYVNLVSALSGIGRYDAAVELTVEGFELAEQLGLQRWAGVLLRNNGADALLRRGRLDEAQAMLGEALALDPVGRLRCLVLWTLAEVHVARGDLDAASQWMDEADAAGDATQMDAVSDAERLHLAAWRGRPGPALEAAERAWEHLAGGPGTEVARLAAMAARTAADLEDPTASAEAAAVWHERCVLAAAGREHGEAGAWLALSTAERSRAEGASDSEQWGQAVDRWNEIGWAFWGAHCRWRQAEALLDSGGAREEAASALVDAHARAQEMGAAGVAAEVEALARRARLSLPGAVDDHDAGPSGAFGLTPRELEVLRSVADGLTNRQIGERLYISHRTVSTHVSRLLDKLGAATRAEAAAIARREGLLGDQ